jgi:hypothetical protein
MGSTTTLANRWECPFYDSEHIWENWEYTGKQPRYNTELFTEGDRRAGRGRRGNRSSPKWPFIRARAVETSGSRTVLLEFTAAPYC